MAALPWRKLVALDSQELAENSDLADEWYNALADLELENVNEKDPEKLIKLCVTLQVLMLVKGTQVQVLEEQLTETGKTEGKIMTKKDQEIEDLKRQIEKLKREQGDLKHFGGSEGLTGSQKPLRTELHELRSELDKAQNELRQKERQLVDERRSSDQFLTRAEEAEKMLKEERKRSEALTEDVRDMQRQLAAQRDSEMNGKDVRDDFDRKMQLKNKLLNALQEESTNLALENEKWQKKVAEAEKKLADGLREIELTTNDYLKLKQLLANSDSIADQLNKENAVLKDEVEDLHRRIEELKDDDAIMMEVNRKVEEWQGILSDKDDRIAELQAELVRLHDRLSAMNLDSERANVAMLTKAVDDRDKHIAELTKRLEEAADEHEKAARLLDETRGELLKGVQGPAEQQKRLATLKTTITQQDVQLKEAEGRAIQAEADARAKDKQLNDALDRMAQYEQRYGLVEAVAEIKELKNQINARDRQIEELTKVINKDEMHFNDLLDENEELRERLGLNPREPIDVTDYRKKKLLRMNEDRALNRILQKEVENLEEERMVLKTQIRKMAQNTSQRAVALGLTADEIQNVENYMEELKAKRGNEERVEKERDVLKVKNVELEKEAGSVQKKAEKLGTDNAKLKAQVQQLEEENRMMEAGLREVHEALKQHAETDKAGLHVIECPTLDRLLAAMESKDMIGRYDASVYMKAQLDNLRGHNEELRSELRETRVEGAAAKAELEKIKHKLQQAEQELKILRQGSAGAFYQAMPLPEGLTPTSSDVIASLNDHLINTLQELSAKESLLNKAEVNMEKYQRKFAVLRHQQGLLYQDYLEEKKKWEEEKRKLSEELSKISGLREEDKTKVQEFERLLDSLGKDEDEIKRRLAESTRRMTVLRVNENVLKRKYSSLQDMETTQRKENNKMKNDVISMEAAVTERIGYLQRYKDMASFKIASLQKQLENTVPSADLEKANREFNSLTEKYRDLLERCNGLVAKNDASTGLDMEVKRLQEHNQMLSRELEIEKEKLHSLEAALDGIKSQGLWNASNSAADSDTNSTARRLTMLEMKELNERQRADHAVRMYDQQKKQLRSLEDRNFELENKFAELTKLSLQQQKIERELRDELANCVTKEACERDRRKILQLEESEAKLKLEVSRLKDISDVASTQVFAIEALQQSHEKEVTSLRQQLLDIQAQSDEKTVIGKLHRHIVALQVSEGTAVRKLEEAMKKIRKLESLVLSASQKIDEKEETLYHSRQESGGKVKHLKRTVQELRRKYTGAIPLQQQEKFADQMVKLQESKQKMEAELMKVNEDREKVEGKLADLELQHTGLQELILTLKDGKGAQKVAEWHSKMEQLRLEDVRRKREIEKLKDQKRFLESVSKKHENEVLSLEEEKVRLAREFELREMEWERREVELERSLAKMEAQQREIAGAASQFEDAVGSLPDSAWPIAKQLDHAVTTIKKNVKLILDTKGEAQIFKSKVEGLENELKAKDKELLQRDRIITELRLRLPASAERDQLIAKVTASTTSAANQQQEDVAGQEHAMKVAAATVSSLQARLAQKEETIQKYQQLLHQARNDIDDMSRRHEEELQAMQRKLHSQTDDALNRFKDAVKETLRKPQNAIVPTNEQLRKLMQLEDMVAEQDNAIAALREKLKLASTDSQQKQYKYEEALKKHESEKDSLVEKHDAENKALMDQIVSMQKQLGEKDQQLVRLAREVEEQRELNAQAPSESMKKRLEKLQNEAAMKEKQNQALSKALMDLRSEMTNEAEKMVVTNAQLTGAEQNVQKIVDKKCRELQEKLDEMDLQNQKLKKDLKKQKEKENAMTTEMDEKKLEISKLENQVQKLKADKLKLEGEIEELERKVERMSTMQKQKGNTEALKQELDEQKRRNAQLEEDLKRVRHQPEKPYEQQGKDSRQTETEQVVAKWEESKKWQKIVDKQKVKLAEKDEELERVSRTLEQARHALDRANKEKESLETKLRRASSAVHDPVVRETVATVSAAPLTYGAVPPLSLAPAPANVQELKARNYDLEEELSQLKRQLMGGRDRQMEETRIQNRLLAERIRHLESQLAATAAAQGTAPSAYQLLADREQQQQRELIKVSEENIELRFEVEQAKKDIPRLKERVEDLQKYVEVLKMENEQLRGGDSARLFGSTGSASNIRRLGESGKSTKELEKTIALLKKVVERVQIENEQLKKTPGVLGNRQMQLLHAENQTLKSQLEELQQKMGSTLSERYTSQQKATAKMMTDYETMRRDLLKEQEASEKVKVKLRHSELKVEQLQKEVEESKKKLEIEEAKRPMMSTMDSKGWKSVVVSRMYEDRMKAMEEDRDKKTKILEDVKILLREAAAKEQQMLYEIDDLNQKVALLERFPPGVQPTESDIVRDYQQLRLKVDRLECEKRELMNELMVLRKRINPDAGGPADVREDDVVEKLRSYDKILTENVDIRLKLKAAELEREQYKIDIAKLKKELDKVGPEFFEELEDLKYNYREAMKRNVLYEEQLSQLSRQFGVAINIPGQQ